MKNNKSPDPVSSGGDSVLQAHRAPLVISAGIPLLMFLVSTAYLANSFDPYRPVKIFVFKLIIFAGILSWIKNGFTTGKLTWARTPVDFVLTAILFWTGISVLWSLNRPLWFNQWILLLFGAALFFLTVFYFRNTETIEKLLLFSLAPVFLMAPLGLADLKNKTVLIWDYLLSNPMYSIISLLGYGHINMTGWSTNFSGKVSSTLGNPAYLAGFVVLLLPVAFILLLESKTALRRAYTLAALIMLVFLDITTYTRSAWLTTVFSFALLFLLLFKNIRKIHLALGLLAIGAIMVSMVFAVSQMKRTPDQKFSIMGQIKSFTNPQDVSRLERSLIWKTSLEMAGDNPLTGVGLGNFEVKYPLYQRAFFKDEKMLRYLNFTERAHNEYLDILAETGIPGLALFLVFVSIVAAAGKRALSGGGRGARLAAGIIAGCAGTLFFAITQFPLHTTSISAYLWIFAGLLVVMGHGNASGVTYLPFIKRKSIFLTLAFILFFLIGADRLSRPLTGQISFLWGQKMFNASTTGISMELMEQGVRLNPGDLEMKAQYCQYPVHISPQIADTRYRTVLLDSAVEETNKALKIFPYDDRFYINLGEAYLYSNDPARAETYFKKALAFNPVNGTANYNLGTIDCARGRCDDAVEKFKKVVIYDPWVPGVFPGIAQTLVSAGEYEKAVAVMDTAINNHQFYYYTVKGAEDLAFQMYHIKGTLLMEMGRKNEAAEVLNLSLLYEPDNSTGIRLTLAGLLIDAGKYDEAVAMIKPFLESYPTHGQGHYYLGLALYKLNRTAEAARELEAAAEFLKDPEPAKTLLEQIRAPEKAD